MVQIKAACRQARLLLSRYNPNLFLVFFGKENQDSGDFFVQVSCVHLVTMCNANRLGVPVPPTTVLYPT